MRPAGYRIDQPRGSRGRSIPKGLEKPHASLKPRGATRALDAAIALMPYRLANIAFGIIP
jgi:hypothetical protein